MGKGNPIKQVTKVVKNVTKPVEKAVKTVAKVAEPVTKPVEKVVKNVAEPVAKTAEKAVKTVAKAAEPVTKPVEKIGTNIVKSAGKTVENTVSAAKHLATGDIDGAVKKIGNVLENQGNVQTLGTVDLTGRKDGIVNIDADKYADKTVDAVKKAADDVYGVVKDVGKGIAGLFGVKESGGETTPTNVADDWDGLAAYVADLRARKRRRSRASTNNTSGDTDDSNKLSNIKALGV
ncbi:MAG: hypothetical protein J6N45_00460 [Alphaproteobacteria bacterium]|nr:hypothetical protein [Alphaproteobacteria bacterium]